MLMMNPEQAINLQESIMITLGITFIVSSLVLVLALGFSSPTV